MKKSLLFCLMSLALTAQAGTLLPPGSQDQSPRRLVSAAAPAGEFERKPVSFAWALDPYAALSAPAPHVAESREFWAEADGNDLRAGLAIDTTAPGAVIRISPAVGGKAVDPGQLRMLRNGQAIAQPQSFQRQATQSQLEAAGMEVPNGSAVVQLAAELGQGRFQVQLPQAKGRYLVHVFEPDSNFVFKAQTGQRSVLAGDTLDVAAVLQRGVAPLAGSQVGGALISPSGRSYPLVFRDGKASLPVPDEAGLRPGLWEVHLSAGTSVKGVSVQRDARTAIEVTRPTARLGGSYGFDAARLRVQLPVVVAAPGRYEVSATLYATGPDGVARPVSQAQSAAWLEPGQRQLDLGFQRGHVPTGFGAPFELRFLALKDQARMGTLETRALALRESSPVARPILGRPTAPLAPETSQPLRDAARR